MKNVIAYEAALFLALLAADFGQFLLKKYHGSQLLLAVGDSAAHGMIAFCSWNVVTLPKRLSELCPAMICTVLATVIDIDHFIIADSWSLADAVRLSRRPPFHATIPLVLASGFICLVRKYYHMHNEFLTINLLTVLGPIALVAVTSHHLRDALRRGIWLWPFHKTQHTPSLPYPLVYALTLLFPLFVAKFIYRPTEMTYKLPVVQDF